uniref:Phosphatidylserine Lipase ABHD16 N-terminal domain-containing protein n=1 Tax=Geospiza parvula TaxID=87175 RepID=A0A8U8AYX9_GEOPR
MAKLLSCVLGPRLYRVHRPRPPGPAAGSGGGSERGEPAWVRRGSARGGCHGDGAAPLTPGAPAGLVLPTAGAGEAHGQRAGPGETGSGPLWPDSPRFIRISPGFTPQKYPQKTNAGTPRKRPKNSSRYPQKHPLKPSRYPKNPTQRSPKITPKPLHEIPKKPPKPTQRRPQKTTPEIPQRIAQKPLNVPKNNPRDSPDFPKFIPQKIPQNPPRYPKKTNQEISKNHPKNSFRYPQKAPPKPPQISQKTQPRDPQKSPQKLLQIPPKNTPKTPPRYPKKANPEIPQKRPKTPPWDPPNQLSEPPQKTQTKSHPEPPICPEFLPNSPQFPPGSPRPGVPGVSGWGSRSGFPVGPIPGVPRGLRAGVPQASVLWSISYYASPLAVLYLYRKGLLTMSRVVPLSHCAATLGLLLAGVACLRGLGRWSNPQYLEFMAALEESHRSGSPESKRKLGLYTFDFRSWPVDFRWDSAGPAWGGSRAVPLLQAPPRPRGGSRGLLGALRKLPCALARLLLAHTLGRRMLFPGSVRLLQRALLPALLQGQARLIEQLGGLRAKLPFAPFAPFAPPFAPLTPICPVSQFGACWRRGRNDAMVIDRRGRDPRGDTLVICCEGNAGFYEVGCLSTPLEGGAPAPERGQRHGRRGSLRAAAAARRPPQHRGVRLVHRRLHRHLGRHVLPRARGSRPRRLLRRPRAAGAEGAAPQLAGVGDSDGSGAPEPQQRRAALQVPGPRAAGAAHQGRDHHHHVRPQKPPKITPKTPKKPQKTPNHPGDPQKTPKPPKPPPCPPRTPDDIASNRGNDLLLKLLQHRYPKVLAGEGLRAVREWLEAATPEEQSSVLRRCPPDESWCRERLREWAGDRSPPFPWAIGEDLSPAQRQQLALYLAQQHLQNFEASHCTPLPPQAFRLPWAL